MCFNNSFLKKGITSIIDRFENEHFKTLTEYKLMKLKVTTYPHYFASKRIILLFGQYKPIPA